MDIMDMDIWTWTWTMYMDMDMNIWTWVAPGPAAPRRGAPPAHRRSRNAYARTRHSRKKVNAPRGGQLIVLGKRTLTASKKVCLAFARV